MIGYLISRLVENEFGLWSVLAFTVLAILRIDYVMDSVDSNLTISFRKKYCSSLFSLSQANEMLHHKANLNGYLAYHTGQSLEKINQDTDRDFFMSAKEAKEYGLIDGVIVNPLKALQPLAAVAEQQ